MRAYRDVDVVISAQHVNRLLRLVLQSLYFLVEPRTNRRWKCRVMEEGSQRGILAASVPRL